MLVGAPARAQDAATLRKNMIGQWELSTTERSKTCVVTLKNDTSPQGLKLELEPDCAKALPFTKDIAAWNIKGLDIVRLQNPDRRSGDRFHRSRERHLRGHSHAVRASISCRTWRQPAR
jgi:hypothetical protein